MGSSVAYKTIGTFQREDDLRVGHQQGCSSPAAACDLTRPRQAGSTGFSAGRKGLTKCRDIDRNNESPSPLEKRHSRQDTHRPNNLCQQPVSEFK